MIDLSLNAADWLALSLHFLSLSLLAVGGTMVTAPEMHRYLVGQQGWLSDADFVSSVALAQAAPGPNLLFVALLAWHVGLNAGGAWSAALAITVVMVSTLLPSTILTLAATRWVHARRHWRSVRAFKQGLAPIVVALVMATAFVLMRGHDQWPRDAGLWALCIASMLVLWQTRLHFLWLLALGGLLGAAGWV